ncbi:MAG TPA: DUF6220 domain-containing protein [Solirubrobacteraceae bacterium]|nr:DUF6220 domain-containing protein [Solirubrobacteraceae bacterium]
MSTVAKVHQGLGFLFLLGATIMFFLAGTGAFGEGFDPHVDLGRGLQVVAVLLVILAAVGRREALIPSVVLLVLMLIQSGLAQIGEDTSFVGGLHPLNGLLILVVAHNTARGIPLPLIGNGSASRPA